MRISAYLRSFNIAFFFAAPSMISLFMFMTYQVRRACAHAVLEH